MLYYIIYMGLAEGGVGVVPRLRGLGGDLLLAVVEQLLGLGLGRPPRLYIYIYIYTSIYIYIERERCIYIYIYI